MVTKNSLLVHANGQWTLQYFDNLVNNLKLIWIFLVSLEKHSVAVMFVAAGCFLWLLLVWSSGATRCWTRIFLLSLMITGTLTAGKAYIEFRRSFIHLLYLYLCLHISCYTAFVSSKPCLSPIPIYLFQVLCRDFFCFVYLVNYLNQRQYGKWFISFNIYFVV